jgi:Aldo/keto reductase family
MMQPGQDRRRGDAVGPLPALVACSGLRLLSVVSTSGAPMHAPTAAGTHVAKMWRLDIDTIDLYFQHRVDRITPIEETVGAIVEQRDDGHFPFSL